MLGSTDFSSQDPITPDGQFYNNVTHIAQFIFYTLYILFSVLLIYDQEYTIAFQLFLQNWSHDRLRSFKRGGRIT